MTTATHAGNGWTGGQYSLFRGLFGIYLFVHFVHLAFWPDVFSSSGILPEGSVSPLLHAFPNLFLLADSPAVVVATLIVGAALSLCFAVGKYDRVAAVSLWYLWACLFGRNPLIANPGLPFVGWLLLAHAFLPAAPYGSLAARRRIDPQGDWSFTPSIHAVAWILLALGYSYSGYTKLVSPSWLDGTAMRYLLENPLARPTLLREWLLATPAILLKLATWGGLTLELLYAPLALFRRARPWIWLAMVLLHLGLIVLVDFADLTLGMLMIHLFTFDPRWLPARSGAPDTLRYDGSCGLCHGTVRFVLAEDTGGQGFRFAPLEEEAPGSVIVEKADGTALVRSAAIVYLLDRLGGLWRLLSWLLWAVPRPLRDLGYDFVASIRHRIFPRPDDACPIMPVEYRNRWVE